MPNRLEIGERVRVRGGSEIVDLLTCPTGVVIWATDDDDEQVVNIHLEDGRYAMWTEAREWRSRMTEIFDSSRTPPSSKLLGAEFVKADPAAGTVEIAFHPDETMLNPLGMVQGGFVAVMLDDTMGPTLIAMTGGKMIPSSIDLNISFIRPVKPGRVIARGRVIRLGRPVAFLEAELYDTENKLLARATSSAVPSELGGAS